MDLAKIRSLLDLETIPTETDDVPYFLTKLSQLGFFDKLTENRKLALIALCFVYGFQGILNQTSLMLAIESQDYERAYDELLKQGLRYFHIANVIKDDKIN